MARATQKKGVPIVPPGVPVRPSRLRMVLIGGGFVAAGVIGILVIRARVGLGPPVVDLDRIEREQDLRRQSIEGVTRSEQLIREGKIDQARQVLEQVTEADPKFFPGHLVLGFLFMRQGKLPLAEQATRRAYELEPNDAAVNFQLGQVELLGGKVESAIDLLARAIRLQKETNAPPDARYHVTLGEALLRNGQPQHAADQLNAALDIDREETVSAAAMTGPQVQVALARVLVGRQEMSDATRLFAQAAEQLPDQPDVQFQAARAYYVQGKFAQAAPLIEQAVALDPGNPTYVQLRRQIRAGQFGPSSSESAADITAVDDHAAEQTEQAEQEQPDALGTLRR
mgnify:CR=1 FL=1